MISHIDHIVLTVRDIQRSINFYQAVLKMEPISFGDGRKALRFGTQKINLHVLGQETRNKATVGSGDICLITDWLLEDVIAQLKLHDVEVIEGPCMRSGAIGQIESVYFNDPDGNLIEVSRYVGRK